MSKCELCGDDAQLTTCDVCGAEACGGCLHLVNFTGSERGGRRLLCAHCIENDREEQERRITERIDRVKAADMGVDPINPDFTPREPTLTVEFFEDFDGKKKSGA